ncbi:NADPH-dependent ferric siderophore reductase [Enemella dayhoffiae]|uniref:NADPH-dependent ferric siderophore reductase n=1 Tax=Enemella dayhoffiae TaxID=2016507 RepID=A0A255H379_9ACTN|nr:siderophore-interacting protein [Enemella dayhoffiae]OYO22131.1 NADPH-dependent ferric siderophore reductase [Enemella dayhoffiae]
MTNITVTHAASGVMRAEVARTVRISPNLHRVTLTGADLARLEWRGFDQWVRLFLPTADERSLEHVPERMTRASYLRMMATPARLRPTVRSYTLREWRADDGELDIDFVVHGTDGVAGPWAQAAAAGDRVALLDQGCGWPEPTATNLLLCADETGLPAVLGVLRDLPASASAHALIEVCDLADAQPVTAPAGVAVQWLVRPPGSRPGQQLLRELAALTLPDQDRYAFAVGESGLATGVRRHLVRERGWAKDEVTFCGYWKQ